MYELISSNNTVTLFSDTSKDMVLCKATEDYMWQVRKDRNIKFTLVDLDTNQVVFKDKTYWEVMHSEPINTWFDLYWPKDPEVDYEEASKA
jgi:hypothetical protein